MDAPHIWVPKFKILEAHLAVPAHGIAGYFKLECVNRYGRVTRSLGPWKQLVTNQNMDRMFYFSNDNAGAGGRARVGTGAPTFVNSSTGLATPIAGPTVTTFAFSNTVDAVGSDNYRERHIKTEEFALGSVVGNLTEIGFFQGSGTSDGMFLDLIRDSGGTPTTFPVTVNDQLRVTHILDRYPFLGSTSGSFTIGGAAGSGSHDYDASMGNLTESSGGSGSCAVFGCNNNSVQSWALSAWRDVSALGANTAGLTGAVLLGANSGGSGTGTATDDTTTWKRTQTFTYGLSSANHANGISGFRYSTNSNATRSMKFMIDPPIPKFAGAIERILTIVCDTSLTRV